MFNTEECYFVEVVDLQDAKIVWSDYLNRQADVSSCIGGTYSLTASVLADSRQI